MLMTDQQIAEIELRVQRWIYYGDPEALRAEDVEALIRDVRESRQVITTAHALIDQQRDQLADREGRNHVY